MKTLKSPLSAISRVATFSAMAVFLTPLVSIRAQTSGEKSVSMPSDQPAGARANGVTQQSMSSSDKKSLARADRRFVAKADEGGQEELALAGLAMQRASSSEVRNFAQQMLTDHRTMANDLQQLANRKNITLEFSSSTASDQASSSNSGSNSATGPVLASYEDGKAPLTNGDHSMGPNTSTGSQIASADHTELDRELVASHSQDRMYQKLSKKSGTDFDHAYMEMMVDDHEEDAALFEKAAHEAKDPEVQAFAAKYLPVLRSHLQKAQSLAPANNG